MEELLKNAIKDLSDDAVVDLLRFVVKLLDEQEKHEHQE